MKLVVTHPFGTFTKGQEITDPEAVKQALADHPEKVVKVATPAPDAIKKEGA